MLRKKISKKRFTLYDARQISLHYEEDLSKIYDSYPDDIIGCGIDWDKNTETPFINIIFNVEHEGNIDLSHVPTHFERDGNKINVRTEFRNIPQLA